MIVAAACSLAAVGQQSELSSAERSIDELVASLDSPSFVDRELAMRALQAGEGIALESIEAALIAGDLSVEQRRRLMQAARRRFWTSPRAAMGIVLGDVTDLGLQIQGTTAGFDAAEMLEAGDIIASIDGVAIRSLGDLQVAIVANAPGEVVPVVYLRDGAREESDIRLGSWGALGSGDARPRVEVMELAWAYRSRAYGPLVTAQPVPSLGVPPRGEASDLPAGARRGVRRDRPVAGGEARDGAADAAGIDVGRRLSAQQSDRRIDFASLVAARLRELEDRARSKRDRIRLLEADLARAEQQNDEDQISRATQRIEDQRRELRVLDAEIERYRFVRSRDD
ncbi:MAG: PDZ domain-containing protein [Planctomycetota bacterium]